MRIYLKVNSVEKRPFLAYFETCCPYTCCWNNWKLLSFSQISPTKMARIAAAVPGAMTCNDGTSRRMIRICGFATAFRTIRPIENSLRPWSRSRATSSRAILSSEKRPMAKRSKKMDGPKPAKVIGSSINFVLKACWWQFFLSVYTAPDLRLII